MEYLDHIVLVEPPDVKSGRRLAAAADRGYTGLRRRKVSKLKEFMGRLMLSLAAGMNIVSMQFGLSSAKRALEAARRLDQAYTNAASVVPPEHEEVLSGRLDPWSVYNPPDYEEDGAGGGESGDDGSADDGGAGDAATSSTSQSV